VGRPRGQQISLEDQDQTITRDQRPENSHRHLAGSPLSEGSSEEVDYRTESQTILEKDTLSDTTTTESYTISGDHEGEIFTKIEEHNYNELVNTNKKSDSITENMNGAKHNNKIDPNDSLHHYLGITAGVLLTLTGIIVRLCTMPSVRKRITCNYFGTIEENKVLEDPSSAIAQRTYVKCSEINASLPGHKTNGAIHSSESKRLTETSDISLTMLGSEINEISSSTEESAAQSDDIQPIQLQEFDMQPIFNGTFYTESDNNDPSNDITYTVTVEIH